MAGTSSPPHFTRVVQEARGAPLLQVRGLKTYFEIDMGRVRAVDGVDFSIACGKTLALVGESGCGKSVTARSIIRTIQKPGTIVGGEILLEGEDLLTFTEERMRKEVRGKKISMIFQEPMTSLNPVFKVIHQIAEAILLHRTRDRREAARLGIDMMRKVRVPSPEIRAFEYPHVFSGGMRQRAMIAMALACHPALLIADEPTTALDVTVQMQILELMKALREELWLSILLITHDLGIVAEMADDVAVMYAGKIVEHAAIETLFTSPRHPYTRALFKCLPRVGERRVVLETIPGSVPALYDLPPGCAFAERCPSREPLCSEEVPELIASEPGHWVRCHGVSRESRGKQ